MFLSTLQSLSSEGVCLNVRNFVEKNIIVHSFFHYTTKMFLIKMKCMTCINNTEKAVKDQHISEKMKNYIRY